jgi:hypothetical protein
MERRERVERGAIALGSDSGGMRIVNAFYLFCTDRTTLLYTYCYVWSFTQTSERLNFCTPERTPPTRSSHRLPCFYT